MVSNASPQATIPLNSSGKSRGFGFVEFESHEAAAAAVASQELPMEGRKLVVSLAFEHSPRARVMPGDTVASEEAMVAASTSTTTTSSSTITTGSAPQQSVPTSDVRHHSRQPAPHRMRATRAVQPDAGRQRQLAPRQEQDLAGPWFPAPAYAFYPYPGYYIVLPPAFAMPQQFPPPHFPAPEADRAWDQGDEASERDQ